MAKHSKRVEEILESEQAASWQAQLAECFFDADAKREIIREIRDSVADLCRDREAKEIESLQAEAINHLVGLASRDATPPEDTKAPLPDRLSGSALEDAIIEGYPNPIAVPYRVMTEQESAAAAFGCLLDTFESLLHYLATVAVSSYLRSGIVDATCNCRLLEILIKNNWSTGDLFWLLLHPINATADSGGNLPYAALPAYLFRPNGKPTAEQRMLESFITLRNRVWGHGTGRDESFYASILSANRARLDEQLSCMHFLTEWELVRPVQIDESGVVRRVDQLMGDRRRKDREYDLQLDSHDLSKNDGNVRAEKSILLVSADRARYLPLYPLSLFGFSLRAQGMYFLQRTQWAQDPTARRLLKAHYVAYESGLPEHAEEAGEPATQSLTRIVQKLEGPVGEGMVARELHGVTIDDPDVELPEVVHEQKFHLRLFAGREALLSAYADWIDASKQGGYLLILGGPGQGKSAIIAQLAHREEERGCLLHMVKSHRNPRRFLPSMIRQAARLLGTPFGESSYQGDIDDLRSELFFRAAEALRERFGRAVILLDALDELEATTERVEFLPSVLPPGVRVILTCRPDTSLVQHLRSRLRQPDVRELPPLSADDLGGVLERHIETGRIAGLAQAVNWSDVFRRLHGNPLFLQRAIERIQQTIEQAHAAGIRPQIDISTLPASLDDLFLDIYNEIASKRGGTYTNVEGRQRARMIQLFCLAREPLAFEQLTELFDADGNPISLEECRDRVGEMSRFLLDVGGERFKPWHQGLADYIREHILGRSGVKATEAVFCKWLASPQVMARPYALRHRVSHMIGAEHWDQIGNLLTRPRELMARLAAGGTASPTEHASMGEVFCIQEDYRHALTSLPDNRSLERHQIAAFARAFSSRMHIIGLDNSQLLPQLYASLAEILSEDDPVRVQLVKDSTDIVPAAWLRQENWGQRSTVGALLRTVRLHAGAVTALAVSPIELLVASGDARGNVHVWAPDSGATLASLTLSTGSINALAFSADGARLVVAHRGKKLIMWSWRENRLEATQSAPGILCLSILHCPHQDPVVVSGDANGCLTWWTADTLERLADVPGAHQGPINTLATFPHGDRFVSGGDDRTICFWDSSSRKLLESRVGHNDKVLSLAVSRNGKYVASGSRDRHICVWQVDHRELLQRLVGHTSRVEALRFVRDGTRLLSGSYDTSLRLWNVETGESLGIVGGNERHVLSIGEFPDEKYVLSSSNDGTVKVWSSDVCRDEQAIDGHCHWVLATALSGDNSHFISASRDGTARIWAVRDPSAPSRLLSGHHSWVQAVAVRDGKYKVVTGGNDKTVRQWNLADSEPSSRVLFHHDEKIRGVAAGSDWIAVGGEAGSVTIWMQATRKRRRISFDVSWVTDVAKVDDNSVLIRTSDRTVHLIDIRSARELRRFGEVDSPDEEEHDERSSRTTVAASSCGNYVFSGDANGRVRVWCVQSGKTVFDKICHKSGVRAGCMIASTLLATAGHDCVLRVWSIPTETLITSFHSLSAPSSLTYLPDKGQFCLIEASLPRPSVRLLSLQGQIEIARPTG